MTEPPARLDCGQSCCPVDAGRGSFLLYRRQSKIEVDWDDDRVRLLGGNQGDAVSAAWFPMSRVLGYRIPA
jgi:hypothetical protein